VLNHPPGLDLAVQLVLHLHNYVLNPLKLHMIFPVPTNKLRHRAIEPVRNPGAPAGGPWQSHPRILGVVWPQSPRGSFLCSFVPLSLDRSDRRRKPMRRLTINNPINGRHLHNHVLNPLESNRTAIRIRMQQFVRQQRGDDLQVTRPASRSGHADHSRPMLARKSNREAAHARLMARLCWTSQRCTS
jgi:hypothetical protein